MKKNLSIIVASSLDFGIGFQNKLCWNIPEELKYFRDITSGCINKNRKNCIIMGKNTWYSLPKAPLQNRINIIISYNDYDKIKNEITDMKDVVVFKSIEDAFIYIDSNDIIEPFSDLLLDDDYLNQFNTNNFEPKILEYNFEYIDPNFFEKEFKIKITNKDSGYIYLFGFDGRSETFIPIGTNNNSKIFLNKRKSDIILPETDFFINYGSKQYILLISKEVLNDDYIEQICSKKYQSIKEFINFNFGINLVLKSPEKIANTFKLYNDPGKILPIIISLKNLSY